MSDFSPYFAGEIVDWMSQDAAFDDQPSALYVSVFDDTDTELDDNLTDARAGVSTEDGWDRTNTSFENTDQISLGEASTELTNVTDVALFDAASDGNVLARYEIEQAPFNVSEGSELSFEAGELSFDVIDTDAE